MKIAFNPSNSDKNILDLIKNNKDIIFDLKGHSIFARGVEFKGTDTWRPVVDNLISNSTTSSLSANQGRVLKSLIDGKSNSGHTHDDRYLKLTGGTMTGNIILSRSNAIIKPLASTSNYDSIVSWSVDGETKKYGREIGLHNLGGSNSTGSIAIVPYKTDTEPWSGTVGLFIAKDTLKLDGKPIAFKSDIPSSLKNPYSLNVFGVTYDGSTAKVVSPSNFISQVTEGTGTVTDGTMFITSWASDNGFADTNAVNVPYKRKAIHLWEYIKAKTDSLYTTKGHNHDDRYLKLTGGTMTGTIRFNNLINIDSAIVLDYKYSAGGFARDIVSMKNSVYGDANLGALSILCYPNSTSNGFQYIYLGTDKYDGPNNLRIYKDKVTFGNNILIDAGNIGSQSVAYASKAGNADKLDGYHASYDNNTPWGTIPVITTSGYMDIGKHLEFHRDNTTGSDYSTILMCTGNYSNIVNLPSASGTLALLSQVVSISDFNWTNLPGKVVAGNEFNIVNAGFNNQLYFNYLPIDNRNGSAAISQYIMGNGNKGLASVYAYRFKVDGQSCMWKDARNYAPFYATFNGGFEPILDIKTKGGDWSIGSYDVFGNYLVFAFTSDSDFNAGVNGTAQYWLSPGGEFKINTLRLAGPTTANMGVGSTNPQIIFAEDSTTQQVALTYTDWDAYRVSKGLKVHSYDGSDDSNVWFEVQGYNYSSGYVKNGSSNAYVLLGGGGHKPLSEFQLGSDSYLPYNGWWASGSGQDINNANGMIFAYASHKNTPFSSAWGIITTFDYTYNSDYKFQLAANGYSNAMYYRSRSADRGGWTSWAQVIDTGNIGSQRVSYATSAGSVAWANVTGKPTIPNPTNYYWANIKVSASSNTQTQPSVNTIYANNWFRSQGASGWYSETYGGGIYMTDTSWIRTYGGKPFYCDNQIYSSYSIKMGNILLEHTDEINNSANGGLHLNYRNTGNVTLCNGGGAVTIGTTSTDIGGNKLYVNGSEFINGASNVKDHVFANGFRHRSHTSNDSVLLAGGGYSQGVPVRYWAIYKIHIGSGPNDTSYIKRSGNHDFITSYNWQVIGLVTLTINFPSGYSKNNTLIFGNGDHQTSGNLTIPVCVTIITDTDFGTASQIRVLLSNDSSLDTGFANIYFMCMG